MARPKGAKDKAPRVTAAAKQAARALAGGIMPLEVMLLTMRGAYAAAMKLQEDEAADQARVLELLGQAHAAAKDAAPYCHAKLASVQHSGSQSNPVAFVIYGEREAGSTEDWAQQHGPSSAE